MARLGVTLPFREAAQELWELAKGQPKLQKGLVWQGKVEEVVASLEALSRGPSGEAAREQIRCFLTNWERLSGKRLQAPRGRSPQGLRNVLEQARGSVRACPARRQAQRPLEGGVESYQSLPNANGRLKSDSHPHAAVMAALRRAIALAWSAVTLALPGRLRQRG